MTTDKMSKRTVLWSFFLIFLLSAALVTTLMTSISASPPTHDVAVTKIALSYNTTVVFPTWENPLNISVTVKNNGSSKETFNLTAYYYNKTQWNSIQTKTVEDLAKGTERNETFTWDCRNLPGYPDDPDLALPYPVYGIKANATLAGDANPSDNELPAPDDAPMHVTVQWPGDCDGDGYVNDTDLEILNASWFSQFPDPNYNASADFDGDGMVSGWDLGLMSDWWHKGPRDHIDIAVTNITLSYDTWVVYTNCSLIIYVTVKNNGTQTETFDVIAYYNTTAVNTTVIDTKQVTMTAGEEKNVTFTWIVPDAIWPYCNYTLSANSTRLGDENPANNELTDGTLTVRWPGDCNGDGHVNATDLFNLTDVAKYYPYYHQCADFDGDDLVNIKDVIILADHWETGPLDS